MEFSEIAEINDMINYSKSFRPILLQRYAKGFALDDDFQSQDVNFFTYEDLLNNSFASMHEEVKGEQIQQIISLDFKNNQSLEEILADITNSFLANGNKEFLCENEEKDIKIEMKKIIKMMVPDEKLEKIVEEDQNEKEEDVRRENQNQTFSENINLDKKKIEKLEENHVSQTFTERKLSKSYLTRLSKGGSSDNNGGRNINRMTAPSNFSRNTKTKMIKVFFFVTPTKLSIPINVDLKVIDVLRTIMEFFLNEPTVDKTLLKYPSQPEAYQLRVLDDDDDFKPELAFEPLELERKLSSYDSDFLDCLAFCENPNFKPILPNNLFSEELENDKKKKQQIEEILQKKNKNVLQVTIQEENYTTMIAIDPENCIKDVFPIIQKKYKINPLRYTVHAELKIDSDFDIMNEDEELDINMPLKNLKNNKLKFKRKVFADDPNPNNLDLIDDDAYTVKSLGNSEPLDPTTILMNEVQASKYEEFEVVKINNRGKRQIRLLGIDQFKIYNRTKERDNGITTFFSIFSTGNGAKNPERLIETIKDLHFNKGSVTQFYIECIEENLKVKKLTYEVKDSKIASYIFAKLNYLMNDKKKTKRMKKTSC